MIRITKAGLAKRLTKRLGVDVEYPTVSAIIDLMVADGKAKVVGNEARPPKTKGKPSKVYEVEPTFNFVVVTEDEAKEPQAEVSQPKVETPAVSAPSDAAANPADDVAKAA